MPIPPDIEGVQKINNIRYNPQPAKFCNYNETQYAQYFFLNNEENIEISITANIELYDCDYMGNTDRLKIHSPCYKYIKSEKYIESNDLKIVKIAKKLKQESDVETVKNIYNYVQTHIDYGDISPKDRGARYVLKTEKGDCTEFADLFVALCRANGLPAREIEGFLIKNNQLKKHEWPEVFLKNKGWVRFEPTPGNDATFGNATNSYIQLSNQRNDSFLHEFHYYYLYYTGSSVDIRESYTLFNSQSAELKK